MILQCLIKDIENWQFSCLEGKESCNVIQSIKWYNLRDGIRSNLPILRNLPSANKTQCTSHNHACSKRFPTNNSFIPTEHNGLLSDSTLLCLRYHSTQIFHHLELHSTQACNSCPYQTTLTIISTRKNILIKLSSSCSLLTSST